MINDRTYSSCVTLLALSTSNKWKIMQRFTNGAIYQSSKPDVSSTLAKAAADLIKALQSQKVGMVNGHQELVFFAHKKLSIREKGNLSTTFFSGQGNFKVSKL